MREEKRVGSVNLAMCGRWVDESRYPLKKPSPDRLANKRVSE